MGYGGTVLVLFSSVIFSCNVHKKTYTLFA